MPSGPLAGRIRIGRASRVPEVNARQTRIDIGSLAGQEPDELIVAALVG